MYRDSVDRASERGGEAEAITSPDVADTVAVRALLERDEGAPVPAQLGRYVILEQIGRGGMGRVLRAYDPKLRREVALKLVGSDVPDSEGRSRVVREAQAMARLSHPNIVPVYDVESQCDAIYITMEYVRGETLASWLAAAPHPWEQVLSRYLEAGRGLVAAHAGGMVHRDFKPSNVMIGADGRVRVMDFGLVCTTDVLAAPADGEAPTSSADILGFDTSGDHTIAGTLMGTLQYMAPEQHRCEAVGPAADQYAFCVALYEGLFGARPFQAGEARALLREKERGPPHKRTPVGSVPAWLRAAVLRGLHPSPAARWPSMQALLTVLEHGRSRTRRRQVAALAVAVATVGAAAFAVDEVGTRQRADACEREGQVVYERWNDQSRTGLRAGLTATGVSYAEVTADKLMPWLDRRAEAWAAAATEACARARVQSSWDDDTLERAKWCLAERRMASEALVDELSHTDAIGLRGAVSAAAGLSSEEACLDADRLRRMPAPPAPEARAEIDEVRAQLSRSAALRAAAHHDEAISEANAALQRATELNWPPLVASAQLSVGLALGRAGRRGEEEAELEKAYFTAADTGESEVAAAASIALTLCVGSKLARIQDGLRWAKLAELALRSSGDYEGLLRARLDNHIGATHSRAADHPAARARYEQALARAEQLLGPEHPDVAVALGGLANVHQALGNHAEARALGERALAIMRAALGPEHPTVAGFLIDLANTEQVAGAPAKARALYEDALAIQVRTIGPDHLEVATTLNNLALNNGLTADGEQARKYYERAVVVLERNLGQEHPDVAKTLTNLAWLLRVAGNYDEAERLGSRAVAIQEKRLGPKHPDLARSANALAMTLVAQGSYARAKPLLEQTLGIVESASGSDDREVAGVYNNLGLANHRLGALAEAERLYRRALAILEARDDSPSHELAATLVGLADIALDEDRAADGATLAARALRMQQDLGASTTEIAGAKWSLARAQWATGGDRREARQLAEDAAEGFAAAGKGSSAQLSDARAWLATHAYP